MLEANEKVYNIFTIILFVIRYKLLSYSSKKVLNISKIYIVGPGNYGKIYRLSRVRPREGRR